MYRYFDKSFKTLFSILLILILFVGFFTPLSGKADESGQKGEDCAAYTARPSVNGALHTEGTCLADASGEKVQLRGVSTHGLTWYPDYVNPSLFQQIAQDWNGNLIRLAMYSDIYCKSEEAAAESESLLRKGIDAAIESDMYVLVDWHILEDNDPNQNIDAAIAFFDRISADYSDCPNILFEICNEPNGETDWADVLRYSNKVIPVIRKNMPQAVIVAGTPEYDRNLGSAVLRPLDFENIMYVLHFYAASHHEGLMGELKSAVDAGLPVFISECGICESDGDGIIDFDSAREWFRYLSEQKISYTVWSLSDKEESSAFFKNGFDPYGPIKENDLSASGLWVRELIRGADPEQIPAPAEVLDKGIAAKVKSLITMSLGENGYRAVRLWGWFAAVSAALVLAYSMLIRGYSRKAGQKLQTYDSISRDSEKGGSAVISGEKRVLIRIVLTASSICTLIYLSWRMTCSVPVEAGPFAAAASIILLVVEVIGFVESMILYQNLMGLRKHPLPVIPEEEYPDVDIFIATYNEPAELLRRTVNGCLHMKYPDRSRVHIWICDDNRRPAMRKLAEEMGVGYFDRPDNKGAKAGNLNHALERTSAPYVVTFDADMIPKSDFLLKTIPYFVDVELMNRDKPQEEQVHLGLLQTPQCFYDPDVFQHALYSERRAPNEQDFFYRTIEPAKTSTNSVIYGGSNTILSRKALEDIGGFYTESITEDFATGLLIESCGYVSLALPEPLASGQTPHTFREHIKQRTRWGRGVIATARKLKIWRRRGLTFSQKVSYWSSVTYWYSPLKNMIYIISPLLFAVFGLPVFRCSWLDLIVYWLPMYILQDISLMLSSRKTISHKWSGIYETSVMPRLLIPILKESLGISMSAFKVTEKTRKNGKRVSDTRSMIPFIVLAALSAAGIARVVWHFEKLQTVSLLILIFWLVRNLYFLVLAIFLVDGRDSDTEPVRVIDAVPVFVESNEGEKKTYEGVSTLLTEHNITVFLDEGETLGIGASVTVTADNGDHRAVVKGVVTEVLEARKSMARTQTIEILDFGNERYSYWELLYDRIPTLPQSLQRDFGILTHLWQNIAHRVARTRK